MSASSEQVVEALRASLKETERLREENRQLLTASREPIAIVGIGCRYPGGVRCAEDLWKLVADGRDAIGALPTDRGWDLEALYHPDPDHPRTSYSREGGFLYDAADFDAEFFQTSPREALGMDPQHRLLLETSWEALEDAGIDPLSLSGSRGGVFVGSMSHDYGGDPRNLPAALEGYLGVGSSGSVASGILSYSYGLEGPAVSVDTACSSSLVALHLACQALRQGECSLALAGGVSVIATPGVLIHFSRQRGLAPDGRCKAYSDDADGTGVSEGVGVLVLERLCDAVAGGRVVLGVVRGSAVNQDGASNGLTAPSGPSQQRVVREALLSGGVSFSGVDVVEGHGTGTRLGDPIEAGALLATYGQSRGGGSPLWLGSVKSNIGHTQAAAGVAGVIKMVMALRHGLLPRTLHVGEPSGEVDWSSGEVSLLREEVVWERGGEPRRAGVSSFGASGTNAHVILEEPPVSDGGGVNGRGVLGGGVVPWVLSAKGEGALAAQAGRLLERVQGDPGLDVGDVGFSLLSRSVFEERAVVVGDNRDGLLEGLDALEHRRSAPGVVRGRASDDPGGVVFVFPGQGSQWEGMAVELLGSSPVFAEHIQRCEQALAPHVDWSLEDVLRGADGAPSLDRVDVVQPALWAVMVGLAELWRACGVKPVAVIGHSQGEIAAACVAGGMSLEDGGRVVALRSRALTEIAGQGGMMSVALGAEQVTERLAQWDDQRVVVAAVNGPSSVVLSGELGSLEQLQRQCEDEGVRARIIPVSYAAHSPQVEAIRQTLLDGCTGIQPRTGSVPFYSAVTGGLLDTSGLDAEYWYRNLRETVRFEGATSAVLDDGRRRFVEVSPHPVLTVGLGETADVAASDSDVAIVGSLRRNEGGSLRFSTSLAEAWVHGATVDWGSLYKGSGARRVALPTYAFQRQAYWHKPASAGADVASAGLSKAGHPLLGAALAPADGDGLILTGRLSLDTHPWLSDHAVLGTILLPGSAFVELALHAGAQCGCEAISELALEAPLVLNEQDAVQLQVVVGEPDELGVRSVGIYSRADSDELAGSTDGAWALNSSGTLVPREQLSDADGGQVDELTGASWPPSGAERLETGEAYARLAELGMDYGPAFQGLQAAWRRGEEIFAEVSLSPDQRPEAVKFGVHPALLDMAVHGYAASLLDMQTSDEPGGVRLPFSLSGVSVDVTGLSLLRVRVSPAGPGAVSLVAADQDGTLALAIRSLAMRPLSEAQLSSARGGARDCLFCLEWVVTPAPSQSSPGRLAALGSSAPEIAGALSAEDGPFAEVYADLEALGTAIDAGAPTPEIVLVEIPVRVDADRQSEGTTKAPGSRDSGVPDTTIPAAHAATHEALALAQSWLADERLTESRLVVLTRGALGARGGEQIDLAGSPVWGLIRSAQAEDPGRFTLVDIDGERASWGALAGALRTEEPQLAIREGSVLAARLRRAGSGSVLEPPPAVAEWRLEAGAGGTLDALRLVAAEDARAPLQPGEVRIAMRAAGLNFRDVVTSLGLVPLREGEDLIGSEGAGVVLEVGSDVQGIEPGDRVMGMLSGAFGTVVVADRRTVVRIPAGWSFTRAASVCGAFLTAHYGLIDLAKLQPGERVLVHAAAGGVGMAAVQLAKHIGAEVWATASPGKWDALRELGVEQARIASSRDLDFKQRFLEATDGGGMDVVLNSLAREYVDASCELLPRGGRFVEMGKTDIRDARQVAETHAGVEYRAFDLPEAGIERIQQMLVEIVGLLDRGALEPLPVRTWDVRHAREAFRFMSQARHVGKIVLTLPPQGIEPFGTALITGGTGELGSLVARHLVVEHGMRHLVIASRRGPAAPGAKQLEAELAALGAEVTIAACDVSEREQLAALIDAIPARHPLSVVVHSAGALDDGVIGALTPERIHRVFAAKVDAAWHLHELTEQLDLQAFVLFSSAAGTLGQAGQGNYAAANVFLDALVAKRQALGLPGVSMAWGAWEQVSEMTSGLSETDLMRVARAGVGALSSAEGLELFDLAHESGERLMLPVRLDLASIRAQARLGSMPALLRDLVQAPARTQQGAGSGALRERLAGLAGEERRRVVLELVCAEVATVLGHSSPDAIEVGRAFKELGFDSLLAVELRNRLGAATGLRLPSTLVFDYPSPAALADHVLNQLAGIKAEPARPSVRGPVDEPLAIVGMSCRYPGGVRSPRELWDLVSAGADAIAAFPEDRGWDLDALFDSGSGSPGTSYAREGGFVHDAGEFDAAFFGISPREALAMDPQQRLLLEASWEAFEDAGLDPHALRGSETGVFVGVGASAYGAGAPAASVDGFRLTGTFGSVASGRIAYAFGLEGPAVSIDTACSSSLVALHLAGDALRSGECSLALAGGVTVMATPEPFVEFSRQRGLAQDGRSKSFSASADGAGWGEGVGVLLLERLSDARRDGHRVLAVVRGSAINQDGASNGLTAPNGPAQQRVILRALENAGLSTAEVDAVEAHGTGTVLGDPIEAQAVLATYGRERERPLWLGSIKSNFGHTQHAAGVAGVIKMVMALRNECLPPTLHVNEPSIEVDWSAGAVSLLLEETPWHRNGRPRRAGVSSFGVSGTNAHVILEEAPLEQPHVILEEAPLHEQHSAGCLPSTGGEGPKDESAPAGRETAKGGDLGHEGVVAWVLSARGSDALRARAAQLRSFVLADSELTKREVGLSLAVRSKLEDRAVVLGGDREELLDGLASVSSGETAPNVVQGALGGGGGNVAFLFTGQGAQRAGMGSELYQAFPAFRKALDELCAELDPRLGQSLLEVMFAEKGSPAASLLDETMLTQASLFALEVSLFQLLETWGVRPDYLLGHSIGEISAAFVAGVFTLADACELVVARGRLMGALPVGGAMIALQASEEEARELLRGLEERVALAAMNGPSSVVLSGDEDAVSELAREWSERGRKVKRLQVSHAFHSPRMEAMLEDFARVAGTVSFAPPRLALVSNLSGERASEELCSPDYWVRQVRETVRFADGVRWLADRGVGSFLELGPDGVLSAMADECLRETGIEREELPAVLPALKEGIAEARCLIGSLAELWTRGAAVEWAVTLGGAGANDARAAAVELPTYPFQRQRYWLEGVTPTRDRAITSDWRYRVSWKPVRATSTPLLPGSWLVLIPSSAVEDPWVASLIAALGEHGARIVSIEVDCEQDGRERLAGRLHEALANPSGATPIDGVLSLLALEEERDGLYGSVPRGLAATLALEQALEGLQPRAPLWLVTRGAVSVASADRACAPVQAQTWGLGLTIGLEHPQSWGGLVDLPELLDERVGSLLAGVLAGELGEDQLAIRSAGVFARRLVRSHIDERLDGEDWSPPSGTVLITGGTGGLGAHVARWLAAAGAEHLLLISRSGADASGAEQLRAQLGELGSRVTIAACDVTEREQLARLIDSLPEQQRLSAVVHAAGAGTQSDIGSLSTGDLEQALAAKAQGALHLDALTEGLDLSAFVLFSSIAGSLGSGLQAPYAAANACLDALAAGRRARGLPASSIAWGPWEGEGMATEPSLGEALRRHGLAPMPPLAAIEALRLSLLREDTFVAVADIDWDSYAPVYTLARPRPLIEDIPAVQAALRTSERPQQESVGRELRGHLLDASPEDRRQMLLKLVRTEVARVLGHVSADAVEPKRAFKDLGFDSLTAVELRNRLDALTGLGLPATLAFDYPTPVALADHLLGELAGESAGSASVEVELTRLEHRLVSLKDGAQRSGAAARLRVLLAQLEGGDPAGSPGGEEGAVAVQERMQAASDEEIFDFIDQELGAGREPESADMGNASNGEAR